MTANLSNSYRVILGIITLIIVFVSIACENSADNPKISEPILDEKPFDVRTRIRYGDHLTLIGEVALHIPDGFPQPIVIANMSSRKIYGIDDESYKRQYDEIKREYCAEIDKVVNEVAGEERIGFRYFVRFRIRPDGSVREVDIVHSDHTAVAYAPFEDTEMKSELESEMSSWQFPETENEITHYCWLDYSN